MGHWLQHAFGFWNGAGNSPQYLFWSGVASDLTYLGVLWGAFALYRKHNCKRKWCWRIGGHEFTDPEGVSRLLCWRHHPAVKSRQLTAAKLREFQGKTGLYLGGKPGRG